MTRHGLKNARNAVVNLRFGCPLDAAAVSICSAAALQARVIHELGHEKVQFSVIVVVEPYGTRRPARRIDAAFRRYVGKRPISVVVKQNRAAISSDQEIFESVSV